jgi:two-component system sensor histidine kinase KdpD
VVIGFVECHGRQNTEELIEGLEMVPRKVVEYRGSRLAELDLDAVLRRQPQLALVDELVDSSPEQLRCRMLHGNIYPPDRVPQALTHFFRTDNLTALRELALRFLADETDEELLEHLRQQEAPVVWETAERVLVAVTAAPGTDALLRRAARMASRLKADLDVVHVSGGSKVARIFREAGAVGIDVHVIALRPQDRGGTADPGPGRAAEPWTAES